MPKPTEKNFIVYIMVLLNFENSPNFEPNKIFIKILQAVYIEVVE